MDAVIHTDWVVFFFFPARLKTDSGNDEMFI